MSKRCPENGQMVVYLDCQECETKSCEKESDNTKDRITKNTSITDAEDILNAHGYNPGKGWVIPMAMMLHDCDYILVKGYGKDCYLEKHKLKEE